jgi:hypothetical protein
MDSTCCRLDLPLAGSDWKVKEKGGEAMKSEDLIFELVELAISLAHAELDSEGVEPMLLDIIQKAVQAYEDHTGEKLDPFLIEAEDWA